MAKKTPKPLDDLNSIAGPNFRERQRCQDSFWDDDTRLNSGYAPSTTRRREKSDVLRSQSRQWPLVDLSKEG